MTTTLHKLRRGIWRLDRLEAVEIARHEKKLRTLAEDRAILQALCPHPPAECVDQVGAFAAECFERCGVCGAVSEGRGFRREKTTT